MATNNFKPFAVGSGANVTSQADYEALTALLTGFQSGKASSAQINKAIRQSTVIAALIGQFINAAGLDALDNGNLATLLANFNSSLTTNLSLGTASKRNVGTTTNQIPDMSSFAMSMTGTFPTVSGYQKLPSGLIIQWGLVTTSNGTGTATFPIAFPNSVFRVMTCEPSSIAWGTSNATFHGPASITNNGFTARTITSTGSALTLANSGSQWVALGY